MDSLKNKIIEEERKGKKINEGWNRSKNAE